MHTYKLTFKLGSDAIEHLTNHHHVSPAILETMLKKILTNTLSEQGFEVLDVEHVDDVPVPTDFIIGDLHTERAKEMFNTSDPTKDQRDFAKRVDLGLMYGAWPKFLEHPEGEFKVDPNRVEGDDCAECGRIAGYYHKPNCSIRKERNIEYVPTNTLTQLSAVDAYNMGKRHATRYFDYKVKPLAHSQFLLMYEDTEDLEKWALYVNGYNRRMRELGLTNTHRRDTRGR